MMNSMELEALAAAAARRRKIEQENLKKQQKQEELEVTGVSRSGRVRKKSSKLMDFESPDDIDTRVRRVPLTQSPSAPVPPSAFRAEPGYTDQEDDSDSDGYDNNPPHDREFESGRASSGEWESSGSEAETSRPAHTPAHHSLYMMEKAKKKAVKDSRAPGGKTKAPRKDKGQRKSRITAYVLWARGARHELLKKCPDMDFSAISKRLGEMWANVNFNERHMWKRKAKRFSMKQDELQQHNTKIISSSASVNTGAARQWTSTAAQRQASRTPVKQQVSPVAQQSCQSSGGSGGGGSAGAAGVYRVTGCGAADVAAHLRLLGESLAIIGERLKEHEGQIAVSGSVSVLLDTLLCSLAPLICVTRAVPAIAPPATLLQDTLDNIAYIMPGL